MAEERKYVHKGLIGMLHDISHHYGDRMESFIQIINPATEAGESREKRMWRREGLIRAEELKKYLNVLTESITELASIAKEKGYEDIKEIIEKREYEDIFEKRKASS